MKSKQVWPFFVTFPNVGRVSQDLYVPAYFDTSDGKMDPECEGYIGSDITNNCNNKVKFKDKTLWTLLDGWKVKFEDDKTCIKFKSDKLEDSDCNSYLRMISVFDCCKLLQILCIFSN